MSEPKGCLAAILSLIGIKLGGERVAAIDLTDTEEQIDPTQPLSFRLRDDFLSPAELSFYRVLASALRDQAVVCCKVNLADLFYVARPNENRGLKNKIDRKQVDFLVCDPKTMQPRCGIELDDSSHSRRDRDELVNHIFTAPLCVCVVRFGRNRIRVRSPRRAVEKNKTSAVRGRHSSSLIVRLRASAERVSAKPAYTVASR